MRRIRGREELRTKAAYVATKCANVRRIGDVILTCAIIEGGIIIPRFTSHVM